MIELQDFKRCLFVFQKLQRKHTSEYMNNTGDKYLRVEDWSSEMSSSSTSTQHFPEAGVFSKGNLMVFSMLNHISKSVDKEPKRIRSLKRSSSVHPLNEAIKKKTGSSITVLDPHGAFLQRWNKIFVLSCIISVSIDPLFFYIPFIDASRKCFDLDKSLEIIACVLRSFTDLFYIHHIILQFRTGFIAPSSRVFGRGELIKDLSAIAKRYLSSSFIIDVLSVLPLPQVLILVVIPNLSSPSVLVTKDLLKVVIFFQYIPRFIRLYPLTKEVTRNSGLFTETAWAGAALNLFLYMLASHILGAFWYLFSVERQHNCWIEACAKQNCDRNIFYCGFERHGGDYEFLNSSCLLTAPNGVSQTAQFDFGIFLDALQSRVVERKNFFTKLFYCLWWGLRNLSSLGQNLKTSYFILENLFAILISIIGLFLFSLLIGNMQKYLQSLTIRVEEMRVRKRDAEKWMSHRMLPGNLKERIRRYYQYKWQETRGVEEESLVSNLPRDLRRDIKNHLFWDLLKRVPMFEQMDNQLLDAMCDRLKPVLYTDGSLIYREGDPVDNMIFVMRGSLLTMTTNGGRTGFFNSVNLQAGDFGGEELLTWALDPNSTSILPASTRTLKAVTDVEAFALMADDLKNVASQFRRLHSKQLQHTFRFYSQHWRTWAACFIQAAWRRYFRRKLHKALREEENRLQNALETDGSSLSLGASIYASKFATNALRFLKRKDLSRAKMSPELSPMSLQKPHEPDFTSKDHP